MYDQSCSTEVTSRESFHKIREIDEYNSRRKKLREWRYAIDTVNLLSGDSQKGTAWRLKKSKICPELTWALRTGWMIALILLIYLMIFEEVSIPKNRKVRRVVVDFALPAVVPLLRMYSITRSLRMKPSFVKCAQIVRAHEHIARVMLFQAAVQCCGPSMIGAVFHEPSTMTLRYRVLLG